MHPSVVLATFQVFKRCFGQHSSRMEPQRPDFTELQMGQWSPGFLFLFLFFLRIGELHGEIHRL